MSFPQGDLRLLTTDIAQRLLGSTIPARMAYTALDGTPRVMSTWHVWTGEELVMATYVHCPPLGIHVPARRLRALRAHPDVAVTIDTHNRRRSSYCAARSPSPKSRAWCPSRPKQHAASSVPRAGPSTLHKPSIRIPAWRASRYARAGSERSISSPAYPR